ncbi:MAG: hypothetical protein IJD58_02355 [Lachnospiraceae bacterium]|nr:hypothetical protein [Lachnospiraceae bacterium]
MKKLISMIIVLVIIAGALTIGNCLGWGKGNGNGSGDGTGNGNGTGQETVAAVEDVSGSETEDKYNGAVYAITVAENDYFYDNNRMALEDIEKMLKESKGEKIVEIKEDKASIKAYNKLVELLEGLKVDYVEK